jgi:glycerol-3-phosphate O-acyltransferase
MSEHLDRSLDLSSPEGRLALPKLAFDVSTRINDVTPITPISLVTMALLSQGDRGFTATETVEILQPFISFVEERDLPITNPVAMITPEQAGAALEQLLVNGVVTRTDGLTERLYSITHDQHLAAAYYRNTIIHFFITVAITELALVMAHDEEIGTDEATVIEHAQALRDLLKFEFFFSPREDFAKEVRAEIDRYSVESDSAPNLVDIDIQAMLPAKSPFVLRPFLEAYIVVGETLALAGDEPITKYDLADRCFKMGEQMFQKGEILSKEAMTSALYATGIQLAANRGLLDSNLKERSAFRDELRTIQNALDQIVELS